MPKGIYQRHPPPPKRRAPRTGPKVTLKGKTVIACAPGIVTAMSAREAARQLGRSKGGRTGGGHRFTSETARAAARKLWDEKWRLHAFGGRRTATETQERIRLGNPRKRRPSVPRAALRAQFAQTSGWDGQNPIWYNVAANEWRTDVYGLGNQVISERTALRRLGYLPYYRRKGLVPETVIPVPGIQTALQQKRRRDNE